MLLGAGAAAVVLVVLVLVRPDGEEARRAPLTPTSARRDLSGVVLQGVEGTTTTTVPVNQGRVTLSGTVRTPEGQFVPGATVRAEWWRVNPPQVVEVFTNDLGQWEIRDVAGGRWKVRAYRSPDFATGKVEQVFLNDDAQRQLDLEVRTVEEVSVTSDVEPDPPITDANTQLVVVLAERTVDLEGRTVTTPVTDVPVTLVADASWQRLSGSATETTDGDGRVSWTLRCRDDGQHRLAVSSFYGTETLDVPACIPITATSTTSTIAPPPTSPTTAAAPTTTTTARP